MLVPFVPFVPFVPHPTELKLRRWCLTYASDMEAATMAAWGGTRAAGQAGGLKGSSKSPEFANPAEVPEFVLSFFPTCISKPTGIPMARKAHETNILNPNIPQAGTQRCPNLWAFCAGKVMPYDAPRGFHMA